MSEASPDVNSPREEGSPPPLLSVRRALRQLPARGGVADEQRAALRRLDQAGRALTPVLRAARPGRGRRLRVAVADVVDLARVFLDRAVRGVVQAPLPEHERRHPFPADSFMSAANLLSVLLLARAEIAARGEPALAAALSAASIHFDPEGGPPEASSPAVAAIRQVEAAVHAERAALLVRGAVDRVAHYGRAPLAPEDVDRLCVAAGLVPSWERVPAPGVLVPAGAVSRILVSDSLPPPVRTAVLLYAVGVRWSDWLAPDDRSGFVLHEAAWGRVADPSCLAFALAGLAGGGALDPALLALVHEDEAGDPDYVDPVRLAGAALRRTEVRG